MKYASFLGALWLLTGCQSVSEGQEPENCTQPAPEAHLVEGVAMGNDAPYLKPMLATKGDLDGDGIDDVVDVVVHQPGGSGSFYYLSVNLGLTCGFTPLPAIFLGDRIALDALEVDSMRLSVTFRDRDDSESMVAPPTRLNRWRFSVENGKLKRLAR